MTCKVCGATTGWVRGAELERCSESKLHAMLACRKMRAALAEIANWEHSDESVSTRWEKTHGIGAWALLLAVDA